MVTRKFSENWLACLVLVFVVSLAWCGVYHRWSRAAWTTPLHYGGDSLGEMALAKALATGDIRPVLPKNPSSLGAPFVANWNDFPTIEEGLYATQGLLVRLFGLFAGSNLIVLLAHLLAAVSFYALCRTLGYAAIWSLAGGALFGLTRYAFARNLPHINLTYYWHIPWGLLVAWWAASPAAFTRRKLTLSIVIAIIHGASSIYYSFMFVQLLMGSALISVLRRRPWPRIILPAALTAILGLTFLAMNFDTLYERLVSGPNQFAVVRSYAGLELYALRPVELVIPATHRLAALEAWAGRAYYSQTMLHGEIGSPYLGIVCLIVLGWLAVTALQNALRGVTRIIWHGWGIVWIGAFSIVGGINGIIGASGFYLFRCTNRYSIYLVALLLLFGVRELSRLTRTWHLAATAVVAAVVTLIGLWDQTPPPSTDDHIRAVRAQTLVDREFVRALESRLSPGAMVFELPVVPFPESPQINRMDDYEHFRPYLYSHSLRFSYGSERGRAQEEWQNDVLRLGVPMFVRLIEKYGFSALLINKKAYSDGGSSLLSDLRSAGRAEVLADSDDLICLALQPNPRPSTPPYFDSNWYGMEGTANEYWRWSRGDANIALFSNATAPRRIAVKFGLSSIQPRRIEVYDGTEVISVIDLTANRLSESITVPVVLRPGRTNLLFRTDLPAGLPGNGDSRTMAFQLTNFDVVE